MAISLESAASPGTADEATAVVDAVMAASPADELDWIEWKSSLELGAKTVRGILARHILGMVNRLPEHAAAHAGGRGFVVVGAEPGNRCGVAAADPRYARPLRQADAVARENVQIARARDVAEERERRRRMLLDILSLVNAIFAKAYQVDNPGRLRCKEQLDLSSHLIAMNLDLPDCRTLAGAGQGNEAVTYAVKARYELEAELRKLADPTT